MSIEKNNSLFIKCDCHSHLLEVSKDEDLGTCLTIWRLNGHGTKFSLLERIRWCIHILKTGSPWGDEFIIKEEDKEKLCKKVMES